MNQVFIVIPVYNNITYTLRCLATLEKQTYPHVQTIVVDDGSTDGTKDQINENFPEVVVLQGDGNLWWTGATNLGVQHALKQAEKGDFILALNNDLEVREDYLEQLLKAYDSHQPCLVGSVSVHLNDPERVAFLGDKWNPYTAKSQPVIAETRYSEIVKKYDYLPTDALPGRGMLIPTEVFSKIGLFDKQRFPQYLADNDFSRRAMYAGYQLVVATSAVVMSVVENTGVNYKTHPTWKTFYDSFWSIKSPNRLKSRYHFGMLHSPLKFGYVVVKTLRVTVSFLRAWILSKVPNK
jgi:GT2 family glycosyltransferase